MGKCVSPYVFATTIVGLGTTYAVTHRYDRTKFFTFESSFPLKSAVLRIIGH